MTISLLPYFPEIYPDELLHSVLARWANRTLLDSPGAVAEALFGARSAKATWDLPGRLGELSARLPIKLGLDVETLIERTTLEPFYTAFASATTRAWVRDSMRNSVFSINARLGLAASRIGRPKAPRYCPDCNREAATLHGEFYWRRIHQLPGILVCPHHHYPLLGSPSLFSGLSRHGYLVADSQSCPSKGMPICDASGHALKILIQIAEAAAILLYKQPPPLEAKQAEIFYRGLVRRAGLMRSGARIDVVRLSEGFRERYGMVIPYLEGTDQSVFGEDWLIALTRRHRKAAHPLLHILATLYLEALEPAASNARHRHPSFGDGPWPCRNPLATHFRQKVVERFSQYTNRNAFVGAFKCSCGYEYTRGVDKTGKLGPPRYRRFGPLLLPALKAAIANGDSLRAIERITGLDSKTIAKEAATLEIAFPWKAGMPRPKKSGRLPGQKRSSNRRLAEPRKDWQLFDRREAVRVRWAAKIITNDIPPVRVTAAEVERRLDRRDWLRRRRNVLPRVSAELRRVCETREAFQRRRLHWAINELSATGKLVPAWRVLRLARLPPEWRDEAIWLLENASSESIRPQNPSGSDYCREKLESFATIMIKRIQRNDS